MEKPFYLEFLETIESRYTLPDESKAELWRLKTGYEGEITFDSLLRQIVPDDWKVLSDLNFKQNISMLQIDSLLISPHAIYHFEVKNLKTECEFRDGEFRKLGSNKVYKNYFDQMKRQHELLIPILESLEITVPLVSKLVLINDEDTVKFYDNDDRSVHDRYLKRWQIKPFIRDEIRGQKDSRNYFARIQPVEIASKLRSKVVSEFLHDSYAESACVKEVRKGIVCRNCAATIREVGRYHVCCQVCGEVESKERALVRTICEIGLLNYEEDLTYRMVSDFIGEIVSKRTIQHKLNKHFKQRDTKYSFNYHNPKSSINKAFPNIKFKYD